MLGRQREAGKICTYWVYMVVLKPALLVLTKHWNWCWSKARCRPIYCCISDKIQGFLYFNEVARTVPVLFGVGVWFPSDATTGPTGKEEGRCSDLHNWAGSRGYFDMLTPKPKRRLYIISPPLQKLNHFYKSHLDRKTCSHHFCLGHFLLSKDGI